ncbi:MAG: FAD-dependent oxidoreductase, partial [Alicyclobacillus sp.]|nr:FAD-dependent oxidoreductase [Alicyclobacillus sp.]
MEADVVIVGGGPAGYVAAIRAAQLGGEVVLVEEAQLGGTCLNRGCIPTKTLLELVGDIERVARVPVVEAVHVTPDVSKIRELKDSTVAKLTRGIGFLMKKHGVQVVRGRGRLVSSAEVQVSSGEVVAARRGVLLATGSRSRPLPSLLRNPDGLWDSSSALELSAVPRRLAIVGGGAVGVEFAEIYAGLGAE